MPTGGASLATRIPLVNGDKGTAVPRRLVGELAHELAPAHVVDGVRQRGVPDHRLHAQTLHANRLVLTNDAGREFMGEITATVRDLGMDARDFLTCLVPVLGAELLFGETALRLRQPSEARPPGA